MSFFLLIGLIHISPLSGTFLQNPQKTFLKQTAHKNDDNRPREELRGAQIDLREIQPLADGTVRHTDDFGSHFVIGLEGEVVQCVPLNEVAYASNNRNGDTISIECCHPDDSGEFTSATYESLVRLTRWLMEEYGLDTSQVIRHYDVTGKLCPKAFVEHPEEWEWFLRALEE